MTKTMGFYAELGGTEPPAAMALSAQVHPDRARIADYLDAGHRLAHIPAPGFDPFEPDRPLPLDAGVLTDGVWCWPAELGGLVRRHPMTVDEAAVAHMAANQWRVPDLSDEELGDAGAAFFESGALAMSEPSDPDMTFDFDAGLGEEDAAP
ncbi:MAG: hypothetical protein R8F63_00950 [Acidimicrobiales bacterium]|nr:hypothetical protein [Acidimicrobiales bacterium]